MLVTTLFLALLPMAPHGPLRSEPEAIPVSIPGASSERGLAHWMRQLGAGGAAEREAAQRWLATHLTTKDYGLFAAEAREADAEARRRLIGALGADGVHLGLVVLLCGERDERLRELGERSFEELATRWCPEVTERPVSRVRVNAAILRGASRQFVDVPRRELARDAFDRLSRLSDLGLPLALTPAAATTLVTSTGAEGRALDALAELVKSGKLSYSGVGDWSGQQPGRGAWILVTPRGGARSQSGVRRLRRWCLQVERGRPEAADAARALAACGWPAAVMWLETRWLQHNDEGALEGVLLAAQRGRVARGLLEPSQAEQLLQRADTALADGGARGRLIASRIARALGARPAIGLGGVDDSMTLFKGWEGLTEASRWVRLVVLERSGSGRGDVQQRLMEIVEAGRGRVELRFQALRALCASSRLPLRSVQVDGLPELVAWALERGWEQELLELLDALDVEVGVGDLVASEGLRGFAAHWSLRRGKEAQAARALIEYASAREVAADLALAGRGSWIEAMERWRLSEGRVALRRVVAKALAELEGAEQRRLEEMALLAGGLGAERERAVLTRLRAKRGAGWSALEFELLGALSGGAARRAALDDLLAAVVDPPQDAERLAGLVRGLDRAVHELKARRRDSEAKELRTEVWSRTWVEGHPMQELLEPSAWPSATRGVVVRMDLSERAVFSPVQVSAEGR